MQEGSGNIKSQPCLFRKCHTYQDTRAIKYVFVRLVFFNDLKQVFFKARSLVVKAAHCTGSFFHLNLTRSVPFLPAVGHLSDWTGSLCVQLQQLDPHSLLHLPLSGSEVGARFFREKLSKNRGECRSS